MGKIGVVELAEGVTRNEDSSLFHLDDHNILLQTGVVANFDAPKSPVEKSFGSVKWKEWGTGNSFPNDTRDVIYKNSIIPGVLNWRAKQMASAGFEYGIVRGYEKRGDGSFAELREPLIIPEVEDLLEVINTTRYIREAAKDLFTWGHAYARIGLNKQRTFANYIACQDAMHVRLALQNPSNGNIESAFVDANWPATSDETRSEVKLIDAYYNGVARIADQKDKNYLYPITDYSHGNIYYQTPAWQAILNTAWLEVAEQIALFKKYFIKNATRPAFFVHVPLDWWEWAYPGFNKATAAEKKLKKAEAAKEFNDSIAGVKRTGNVVFLTYKTDLAGNKFTKWEIQPVNAVAGGDKQHIEDSHEASSHIYAAFCFDHTLTGHSPGKGMGAGSGSDKRVAGNIETLNFRSDGVYLLEPFNRFLFPFNGFRKDGFRVKIWMKEEMVSTLNTGAPTSTTGKVEQQNKN